MRKILLATSVLVGFVGAAQAAEAPISITVGGYVDFRAAMFREATNNATQTSSRRNGDFETEYRLNFAAEGKASNGIDYGALVSLWNGSGYDSGYGNDVYGGNNVKMDQAYVWMSGAFGRIALGDSHGVSDMFVSAPTVGEGQIDGSYTDFVDSTSLMIMRPVFFDTDENDTKISFMTPKVGNANHKVQLGVSYAPNYKVQGQEVSLYETGRRYQNTVEGAVRYNGTFGSVGTTVSAMLQTAEAERKSTTWAGVYGRGYFGWGLGAQADYAGFTAGLSYVNAGHYASYAGQDREQDVWAAGVKYEHNKMAVALNGLTGRGYALPLWDTGSNNSTDREFNYVKTFKALGLGATYTWFPGLTSAADVVLFAQDRADIIGTNVAQENDGHVLLLSQKMAF